LIIKWLGHASFKVKTQGKTIYIDPYAGEYDDKADVILISHGHHDHCDQDKISLILQPESVIITSKECAKQMTGKITTLSPGEATTIGDIEIVGVEAYNVKRFREPGLAFHPEGTQIGFLIKSEGKTIYHGADTDFLPAMKKLTGVDLALVPIGGTYTMDVEDAVEATLAIHPKKVIPMHCRDADVELFKKEVKTQSDIKVEVLSEGEELRL